MSTADKMKDSFVSTEHLLLALAKTDDQAKRLLELNGVTETDLLSALKSVRGAQQVNDQRWARKGVAGALLDQGFLAGVGNYLRSEILFAARIEPNARIGELTPAGRQALARAALNLTRQSYRTGGITNDVAIAKRMQAAGAAFGRYRHWVFDRAGEPCHRCGTLIRRDDVGGRGLYWCMRCQAKK